jgi:hypothetical protein
MEKATRSAVLRLGPLMRARTPPRRRPAPPRRPGGAQSTPSWPCQSELPIPSGPSWHSCARSPSPPARRRAHRRRAGPVVSESAWVPRAMPGTAGRRRPGRHPRRCQSSGSVSPHRRPPLGPPGCCPARDSACGFQTPVRAATASHRRRRSFEHPGPARRPGRAGGPHSGRTVPCRGRRSAPGRGRPPPAMFSSTLFKAVPGGRATGRTACAWGEGLRHARRDPPGPAGRLGSAGRRAVGPASPAPGRAGPRQRVQQRGGRLGDNWRAAGGQTPRGARGPPPAAGAADAWPVRRLGAPGPPGPPSRERPSVTASRPWPRARGPPPRCGPGPWRRRAPCGRPAGRGCRRDGVAGGGLKGSGDYCQRP